MVHDYADDDDDDLADVADAVVEMDADSVAHIDEAIDVVFDDVVTVALRMQTITQMQWWLAHSF